LLDDWVTRHTGASRDEDGRLAAKGKADAAVLRRWLQDPYLVRALPKSLDRLHFHACLDDIAALSPADGAATLVAFTAGAVARTALPQAPQRWLVTGGGRHNPTMMHALRDALGVPVEPVEAVGWHGDALEAQCFGFLAARVTRGLPLSLPTTTGVPNPLLGGRIVNPAKP
jgi:anhydro-N-acetylmuramic acid kinase